MPNYQIQTHEGHLLITLSGDITIGCSLSYKEDLKKALADHQCYQVLVDLDQVPFMDSSGLGMLISLFKEVSEHDGKIVFYSLQDYILKLIKLVRLDQVLTIAATEEEAKAKLGL